MLHFTVHQEVAERWRTSQQHRVISFGKGGKWVHGTGTGVAAAWPEGQMDSGQGLELCAQGPSSPALPASSLNGQESAMGAGISIPPNCLGGFYWGEPNQSLLLKALFSYPP